MPGSHGFENCSIISSALTLSLHATADLARLFQGDRSKLKGKIQVPRLNGAKMGVLATRSPHRPVPIGLSVARVLAVEGSSIILGGADIVDGSPVLDIKPYLPFCDGVQGATAPAWVAVSLAGRHSVSCNFCIWGPKFVAHHHI